MHKIRNSNIAHRLGFLDHLTAVGSDRRGNFDAGQLADRGAGETVHRVGTKHAEKTKLVTEEEEEGGGGEEEQKQKKYRI